MILFYCYSIKIFLIKTFLTKIGNKLDSEIGCDHEKVINYHSR